MSPAYTFQSGLEQRVTLGKSTPEHTKVDTTDQFAGETKIFLRVRTRRDHPEAGRRRGHARCARHRSHRSRAGNGRDAATGTMDARAQNRAEAGRGYFAEETTGIGKRGCSRREGELAVWRVPHSPALRRLLRAPPVPNPPLPLRRTLAPPPRSHPGGGTIESGNQGEASRLEAVP